MNDMNSIFNRNNLASAANEVLLLLSRQIFCNRFRLLSPRGARTGEIASHLLEAASNAWLMYRSPMMPLCKTSFITPSKLARSDDNPFMACPSSSV